jgi:hypothetical protein
VDLKPQPDARAVPVPEVGGPYGERGEDAGRVVGHHDPRDGRAHHLRGGGGGGGGVVVVVVVVVLIIILITVIIIIYIVI